MLKIKWSRLAMLITNLYHSKPNGKKEIIILQNASVSKHKNQMQNSSDLMIPSPKRSTTESNESKDESKQ